MNDNETQAPVTIASLELENVKRVRAVALEPSPTGLTVIGGRNAQGKTSVLDAICWTLGGAKYQPEAPRRDGAAGEPAMKVTLSNGIVAQRAGKSHALKVTDPSGARAGQALLDAFVEQFALNVPKFLQASDKDKAAALLKIIGAEEELAAIDREEADLTQQRLTCGQLARRYRGAADALPHWPDAPEEPVDVTELAQMQREAVQKNAENRRLRDERERAETAANYAAEALSDAQRTVERLTQELVECRQRLAKLTAIGTTLADVDVAKIERAIESAQEVNEQVRANAAKREAEDQARSQEEAYAKLDQAVADVRAKRAALLKNAAMPLPGLTVEDGCLAYNGHRWDDMSGSEQMMVATAIVRALNPACGFVLLDKLEQLDTQTLADFGQWCESQGLQVIGTRVSTGEECSVVIEDGMVADQQAPAPTPPKFEAPQIRPPAMTMAAPIPESERRF